MVAARGPRLLRDPQSDLLPREAGIPYVSLLRIYGITEEEDEVPQQVKASPSGPWCKPAVGRAMTCCGKPLAAYLLRDESYLGELCGDGCFAPYELAVLAPQAREAKLDEDARRLAIEAARSLEDSERLRSDILRSRAETRAPRDEIAEARDRKTTTLVGMVPLRKPTDRDE